MNPIDRMIPPPRARVFGILTSLLILSVTSIRAEQAIVEEIQKAEATNGATAAQLEEVNVIERLQPPEDAPFLPDVEGAEIFAGKRTDNIDPNLLPQINNNNYRQACIRRRASRFPRNRRRW